MWQRAFRLWDLIGPTVVIGVSGVGLLLLIFTAAVGPPGDLPAELADTDQTTALIPTSPLGNSGVIFPASRAVEVGSSGADGFWTPSHSEVEMLERQLRDFLVAERAKYHQSDYRKVELDNILARLPNYRRQYVGIMKNGSRHILVNSFLDSSGGPRQRHWQRKFIYVVDGGFYYWRVLYDVESQHFAALAVNGEA